MLLKEGTEFFCPGSQGFVRSQKATNWELLLQTLALHPIPEDQRVLES
jgi:hypothetical protein